MPRYAVNIEQWAKTGHHLLHKFAFTVDAENAEDARTQALKELDYWSKEQPIHTDAQQFMKLQRRAQYKLTFQSARNIITSVKRVRG